MRQILLGKAPLGQGGVDSVPRFLGPPYYLVNDTFTTDRAAGAVNGTDAEPGPGRRTVTDAGARISLTGGKARFAGGVAFNDYSGANVNYWLSGMPQALALISVTIAETNTRCTFGLSDAISALKQGAVRLDSGGTVQVGITSGNFVSVTVDKALSSQFAFARSISNVYVLETRTGWKLLYIVPITQWTLIYYVALSNQSVTVFDALDVRVPAALWLPTPLASDGFSSWGTTDGLGHAEGVAGGLGSGGSGLSWADNVGTWGASGGAAAASALTGGVAIATVDTSTADVLAAAKITRSAGDAGVVVRYADANNYVRGIHNGTNAQLVKVVGGTPTTLINAAATYSAGAEIRVICEGQKFRLYYNNALIGTEQTIADAGLQSGTKQGLYSTDTSNTFDNTTCYARGSGGEYAALDAF